MHTVIFFPVMKHVIPFSVPPMIEATSLEVRITINEPAILVCLITGCPHPSVIWEKNGEVFTDSVRISIFDFEVEEVDSDDFSGITSRFNDSGSSDDLLRLEILLA